MASFRSLRLLVTRRAAVSLHSTTTSLVRKAVINSGAQRWLASAVSTRTLSTVSHNRENPRLRTHAVSIYHGDYSDDGTEDAFEEGEDDEEAFGYYENKEEAELAEWAKKEQEEYEAKMKRWKENAKPPVRVPVIDVRGRAYGRGGRKEASSRVWIQPGLGHVVVNRMDFIDYFPRAADREQILAPFVATRTSGVFDVQCYVQGGGKSGQAGAIRHGLARALNHYNPDLYRPALKRLGYLTRDPRSVERKKVGRKKARKSPQWSRR